MAECGFRHTKAAIELQLLVLSIEKELTDKVDFNSVIDAFASLQPRPYAIIATYHHNYIIIKIIIILMRNLLVLHLAKVHSALFTTTPIPRG